MKALLYTSDPYEPSGVIGLFETEEQKQKILEGYKEYLLKEYPHIYGSRLTQNLENELAYLFELEIPIGVYGEYYIRPE